jgi:hypothetical protein
MTLLPETMLKPHHPIGRWRVRMQSTHAGHAGRLLRLGSERRDQGTECQNNHADGAVESSYQPRVDIDMGHRHDLHNDLYLWSLTEYT